MSSISGLDGASLAIQLVAIEEDHESAEMVADKSLVKIDSTEHTFQREQQFQALRQAQEKEHDSSFWGDVAGIAKDVAVVGAVAAAAFTGGSSLIVAAALIGGACTVGADVAKRAGADEKVVTGLALTGAAFSLAAGGGAALSGVAPVATETSATVGLIGNGVGAGGSLVGAGAGYASASAKAKAVNFNADATAASGAAEEAQTRIDDTIASMSQALRDRKQKVEVIANLQRTNEQVDNVLLNNMRG
jgi:hypothetical protein